MGCIVSNPHDSSSNLEATNNNNSMHKNDTKSQKAIDKQIEKEFREEDRIQEVKCNLLLLGAGESGKTTLLSQMREIHGEQYTEEELCDNKGHIIRNTIQAMRTLAIYSELLTEQGKPDTAVSKENEQLRSKIAKMGDRSNFGQKEYEEFKTLWSDAGIKATMEYSYIFQLIDTANYHFTNMHRYCKSDFVPTFSDLIHSRHRTTGINKLQFAINDKNGKISEIYEIYDVGGQRSERRKWVHFFDHITAIIFVAALSGYNQTLWEDARRNRMKEAIALFNNIVNVDELEHSQIILFLNKSDLYSEKIKKHSIGKYFKDFNGKANDYTDGIRFIQGKFADQRKNKNKLIYAHVTCATDKSNVERMFNSVRDIIVRQELESGGML